MSINWEQFNDGDEVAVTYVGKWHKSYLDNHQVVSTSGQLKLAVDAYRIEPDYKPGDMVRSNNDIYWVLTKAGWRALCDSGGDTFPHAAIRDDLPLDAVRVKVVDA